MDKIKKFILGNNLGEIDENMYFKDITTLKVGGKIRLVYYPYTIEKYIFFHKFIIQTNVSFVVIGLGSNVLASDNYYDGIVISFKKLKINYYQIGDYFYLFPQCKMGSFSKKIMKDGYSGVEYFAGIPGTIGGMVAMNAGCFDKSISDFIIEVVAINKKGEIVKYRKDEIEFGYRTSKIKKLDEIVLLVKLKFYKGNVNEINEKYLLFQKIRKTNQPLSKISAGCAFKNLNNIKAWKIVNKLGYSGKEIGGARVSEKHNNFIVNTGNAKAIDFYRLLKNIQKDALEKMNIVLENEWILINFWLKSFLFLKNMVKYIIWKSSNKILVFKREYGIIRVRLILTLKEENYVQSRSF